MKGGKLLAFGLIGAGVYWWYSGRSRFAVWMPDGTFQEFNDITPELDAALSTPGAVAVRLEGEEVVQYYEASTFQGGWLLNNCPLNVILFNKWYEGQEEALATAGLTPYC